MCNAPSSLQDCLYFLKYYKAVFMVLENDQNGAENEGIFVQTRHPSPWRRQVFAIKVDFLHLDEGVLRIGEGLLHLGEPETFLLLLSLSLPRRTTSPWHRHFFTWVKQCLLPGSSFLLFFPLLCFLFFNTCITHICEGLV